MPWIPLIVTYLVGLLVLLNLLWLWFESDLPQLCIRFVYLLRRLVGMSNDHLPPWSELENWDREDWQNYITFNWRPFYADVVSCPRCLSAHVGCWTALAVTFLADQGPLFFLAATFTWPWLACRMNEMIRPGRGTKPAPLSPAVPTPGGGAMQVDVPSTPEPSLVPPAKTTASPANVTFKQPVGATPTLGMTPGSKAVIKGILYIREADGSARMVEIPFYHKVRMLLFSDSTRCWFDGCQALRDKYARMIAAHDSEECDIRCWTGKSMREIMPEVDDAILAHAKQHGKLPVPSSIPSKVPHLTVEEIEHAITSMQ